MNVIRDPKVSAKGQVTLPKRVRKALGVEPGDRVRFIVLGDQVKLIKPIPIMALKGILKDKVDPGLSVTIEDMNATIAAGWAGELEDAPE